MPELPEVETIVQQLKKRILHKKITQVEIIDPQVADPNLKGITKDLIKDIYRRGKSIVVELESGKFILAHLRLTGQFHYLPKKEQEKENLPSALTLKIYFEDGSALHHHDLRRFGFVKVVNEKQLQEELADLGPEPLEKSFTLDKFQEMLAKKKKSVIKTLLMDQHFLAGIGNIYAQEILYYAGVQPLRKVQSLTPEEIKKTYLEIQRILLWAIQEKGSTIENYLNLEGEGNFNKYLAVYQREHCPKKHLLKKIMQGGRGTTYCPFCQK